MNVTQETVSGTVRLKLFKGQATPAGVKSPMSLYNPKLASFTMGEEYNPTDATGFIRLFGLPLKVSAIVRRQSGKVRSRKSKRR